MLNSEPWAVTDRPYSNENLSFCACPLDHFELIVPARDAFGFSCDSFSRLFLFSAVDGPAERDHLVFNIDVDFSLRDLPIGDEFRDNLGVNPCIVDTLA